MLGARLRRRLARRKAASWATALRAAAVGVALVGVVVSVVVARGWQGTVDRQRAERLERTADARTVTIQGALGHYENALQAARSLFVASDDVDRQDFALFARTLDLEQRYPGLQGIGWREDVPDRRAAALGHQARRQGEPNFTISPPGRRPAYYLLKYHYPRSLFSSPLGSDARAIPTILGALETALATGQATLSSRTTLPDDLRLPAARRPAAFELFVPVYEGGTLPPEGERRVRFLGWASGQFRAGDFLKEAMESVPDPQRTTGVELHDEKVGKDSLLASYPPGFKAGGRWARTTSFEYGKHRFELRHAPLPHNPALTERRIQGLPVLAAGVALSLLLGALLWLLAQVGTLYQQVGRMARTDGLTGVANRRAWDQELPRELARATRSGKPLCVALVDLDHFKAYNDLHGHQAGDRLLKSAAGAWQERLRKTDLLARYGGEEFAVLLPDCGLDHAVEIAERLRPAQPEGTCSIGVAAWDGRESATELVARADRALYAAKKGGRNRTEADRAPATASAGSAPAG
jgi:diguanylate cyclase (GGDEF)-like protein